MTFTDYIFEHCCNLEKTAVIYKNKEISYNQILNKVNAVANLLQQKKYTKHHSVLVVSGNSTFFIETYYGVMKTGSVCVPINPSISDEDIQYILTILDIKLIFTEEKYKKKITTLADKEVEIFSEKDLDSLSEDVIIPAQQPIDEKNDAAMILFTSGSTSKPKGVILTHYNLMYNTNSIIEYLHLTEKDRIQVVLPFYYCYGTSLLNTHFRCGGSVVINNKFMFPESVIDQMNAYHCTGFAGVPSTYQILLRMTTLKDAAFPSLRYITQAGGRLPQPFIHELTDILKGVDIFIMYGQTEATARLSYLPPKEIRRKAGSIGKGIPGTELMVLNKQGLPVRPDEIGEVVAKGGNIMKGYFNDEEETKKVIKNGLLYTGDLATVDEEGYIYIVSREKNIIKSGGNRISPKEIEDVIAQIPAVVECAVIGIEDNILGEAVKAFVVLKNHIDSKYIMEYCSNVLPTFKTPKYVEIVNSLPKNSSGKVLLSKLKEKRSVSGEL